MISICIPAYKRVQYLKRLFESIKEQQFRDFEVVVTDDSGDDDSVQLFISSTLFNFEVRYFKNPTQLGSPGNWMASFEKASGEWIKIMHDDDYFKSPDVLQQFADAINPDVDCIFSGYSAVYEDGRSVDMTISRRKFDRFIYNPFLLFASNIIGPPSVLMFRNGVKESFDKRLKWIVDWEYYIRLARGYRLVYITKPLICVSYNDTQITNQVKGNPSVEIHEAMLFYYKYGKEMFNHVLVYDAWWRLVRNLGIRTIDDFTRFYKGNVPAFLKRIILFQSSFPYVLLNVGPVSKLLMLIAYLYRNRS